MHISILWRTRSGYFSLFLERNQPHRNLQFFQAYSLTFLKKIEYFSLSFLTFNLIVRLIYAHKHSLEVEIRLFEPFFEKNHPIEICSFSKAIALLF